MDGVYDPSAIPLAEPPPGVTPNFVNPYCRVWELYITYALFLAITTLVVILRIYTKVFVIRQKTADDCDTPNSGFILRYAG